MADAGVVDNVAVGVEGDRIVAVGDARALAKRYRSAQEIDCTGCVLTPGLVDSHTHAVFGRPRYEEHELRAAGHSYMEIARKGGGIHSSVRDLAGREDDELYDLSVGRVRRLASFGTTTLEIKSGYGLSTVDELKSLKVIDRLASTLPPRIVPTWLGAHELPLAYRERASGRAEYLGLLTGEMLLAVKESGLARFADIFCEPGVFSVEEARSVLSAAKQAGLGLKLHADELEYSGAAELAVELRAASADHLGAISERGVTALAKSDTVATLLPGTLLFLGRNKQAPARALIDAGAAVALATDFNPGSSPTVNFPLILTLGISQLRMSAAEVIIAATVNGAAALGLAGETGQIAPGFAADLALFEADDFRELPYWYGDRRCRGSWARGKTCHPYEPGLG